jgi:hypothetical protein
VTRRRALLREHNATVLPFRDARMRRPIDVVAYMDRETPLKAVPEAAALNIISLAAFAGSSRGRGGSRGGRPEGDAA